MKYLFAFFITVFLGNDVTAQRRAILPYEDKWAVRFSPLGLLDIMDGNLTAGVAYALSNRLTLSADLSFIFYSLQIQNNRCAFGYIVKPALRYYLSDRRRFFLEAAPFYKSAGYKVNDWLGKDCVNGIPSYEEFTNFTFRKRVVGLNMMAGVQKSLVKNNKLRMEMYVGVNLRYKWEEIKNDPRACYQQNDFFNKLYDPHVVAPGLPHGLRLVYVIL